MPDCKQPAQWVHGIPFEGSFPWHLCAECQDAVMAAEAVLHDPDLRLEAPDEVAWSWEKLRRSLKEENP